MSNLSGLTIKNRYLMEGGISVVCLWRLSAYVGIRFLYKSVCGYYLDINVKVDRPYLTVTCLECLAGE